ncbi:MAG TPA: hypothetical protein VIG30_00670 [Ktedonobacterales bacterium]|jgi:hypothetical protein
MPTYDWETLFINEFKRLSVPDQALFLSAMRQMVRDVKAKRPFHPKLRVKSVTDHPGLFELSWAPNGRAPFVYEPEQKAREAHVIWQRIGGHEIFK